jgi:cytoskeleton protein RodZ
MATVRNFFKRFTLSQWAFPVKRKTAADPACARDIFCCTARKLVIRLAKTRGPGRKTGKTVEKTELHRDEFFEELKRVRESKGLRLEDISRRYKIRLSFLESIESGSFEDLPEPVYTKTFVKTYAGLLGVDAGPILARYAKYIEKTMPAPQPESQKEKAGQPSTDKALFDWLGMQGSKIGWAVFAVAVVIILGIYVFQDSGDKPNPAKTIARETVKPPEKPQESPPAEQTPPVPQAQQPDVAPPQQTAAQTATPQAPMQAAAPQPAPVQAVAPEPKKPEAPPPAEKKPSPLPTAPVQGPLSLKIEATEAAWVQVKADKTPTVQKLMQAGETLTTEAKEKITVDLGNAGGVQITFQGQSLGSPGKRGEVLHLVYPEGKRVEKKKPEEPKPAVQPATE